MNRKSKLLTLVVIVVIVSLVLGALFVQTDGNKNSPIRVACVGDSITEGTGYPLDLWWLLGPDYVVGNFGVGGATVYTNLGSSYMNETAFEVAQRFNPDIVIIMLGTNDANPDLNESNAAFVNDYVKLVNAFQGLASKPKVWIVLPPPIFNNSAGLSSEILMQNVIPNIEQAANQTGVTVIDVNTPLANHPNYFEDGVHPNTDGAARIALVVYRKII